MNALRPRPEWTLVRYLEARANRGLWGGPINVTPIQQRQMEKLEPHIDRATETDRVFFEHNPDRQHRVRVAEIAQFEIESDELLQPPKGRRWFTLVRKVQSGHLRIFSTCSAEAETGLEVPEDLADVIFDTKLEMLVEDLADVIFDRGGAGAAGIVEVVTGEDSGRD